METHSILDMGEATQRKIILQEKHAMEVSLGKTAISNELGQMVIMIGAITTEMSVRKLLEMSHQDKSGKLHRKIIMTKTHGVRWLPGDVSLQGSMVCTEGSIELL